MASLSVEHCELQRSTLSLMHSDEEGDDEVFYEIGDSAALTMASINAMGPSMHNRKRSSVFEMPTGMSLRAPAGSSMMSFAHEPMLHEENHGQKMKPKTQYENTFQMEPPKKFQPERATEIINQVLTQHLTDQVYSPIDCGGISKTLSQEIKQKVKDLNLKRYKIVCMVTIGEKKDQDVRFGSRCVWDTAWDNHASGYFENSSIYAVGQVYALYFE